MRNKRILWLAVLALAIVGAMAWLIHYTWMWSEWSMASIQYGMSMPEVRSRLGEPPKIRKNSNRTESGDYSHWWSRDARIDFTANGSVSSIDTD
jgi:hypothetical protein